MDALSDQGTAGVVMMAESTVVTLAILAWLLFRWASHDTERQELLDLAAERGVELDPRPRRARRQRRPGAAPARSHRERIDGLSGNRYLYALVFVVGTGSLGAEIAVARLMAPFFGASTIVWANTIGVVLVALSIGYWLGGRLADRNPTLARALPDGPRRRGPARDRARSSPSRSSTSPSTRSTRSRPARSSARCSRCWRSSPSR